MGLSPTSFVGKLFGARTPTLNASNVVTCSSILKSDFFQKRFAEKWVLVAGYSAHEVELIMSYGFKKVITLKELLSLETTVSMWIGFDL